MASFPLMLSLAGVSVIHADTDVYFSGNLIADPCELHVDSEDQIVDFRMCLLKPLLNILVANGSVFQSG
jgi:type 1 fimbria pilin